MQGLCPSKLPFTFARDHPPSKTLPPPKPPYPSRQNGTSSHCPQLSHKGVGSSPLLCMSLALSLDSVKRPPCVPLYNHFPASPVSLGRIPCPALLSKQPRGMGVGNHHLHLLSSQPSPKFHLSWEGATAESGYSFRSLPSPRQDQVSHALPE